MRSDLFVIAIGLAFVLIATANLVATYESLLATLA